MFSGSQWVRRAIILCLLFLIIFIFLSLLFLKEMGEQIRQGWITQAQELEILERQARDINKAWKLGDTNGYLKKNPHACDSIWGDLGPVPELQLRCNPGFLNCLLNKKLGEESLRVSTDHGFSEVEVIPWSENKNDLLAFLSHQDLATSTDLLPGLAFRLKVKDSSHLTLLVYLEQNCHEVFLPQRFYPYGRSEKSFPLQTWDNFSRHIFSDRFLVSKADIAQWKKDSDQLTVWDYFSPALNLSREDQEKFCHDQGKRLFTSHLLDAHSFYPRDTENPKSIPGKLAKYPWEVRPGDFKQKVDCTQVFAKECKDNGQKFDLIKQSGWAELHQIGGGPFESLDNWDNPHENLKLSSYYSPLQSPVHYIGSRGEWDQQGFTLSAIKTTTEMLSDIQILENDIDIGFRCYREVSYDF